MTTLSRRQLLAGMAAVGATVAVAACVPVAPAAAPAEQGAGATQETIEIRWNVSDSTSVPVMMEIAEEALAIFQEQNPTIRVLPEPPPEENEQVLTQMIAGTAPDVIGNCCDRLPFWASKKQLIALDDYVARDMTAEQIADYPADHWNSFANERVGRYAMPLYMGVIVLYYNQDAFDEAGLAYPDETWNWTPDATGKYDEAMTALTDPAKKRWGIALSRGIDRLQCQIVGNGGNWYDPANDMVAAFDQEPALQAIQWLFDGTWTRNVVIPDAARESLGWYELMASDRITMFQNGDWALVPMVETVGDKYNWNVAAVPQGPVTRNTLATTDGWVGWIGSKQPDAAWTLMNFLQGDEWNNLMMSKALIRPSRVSLFDKWVDAVKNNNPNLADKNLEAFGTAAEYATPQQYFRYNQQAIEIINAALDATIKTGETTDVRAAMIEAAALVNEAQIAAEKEEASAGGCDCRRVM